MTTQIFFLIVGSLLTCQAFKFFEPADKAVIKYSAAIHASLQKDVNNVADALIHSALGANNITKTMLTTQLRDVIDVQLHSLVEKLAAEVQIPRSTVSDKNVICCQCSTCTRRCTQCSQSCCCNGSGLCLCTYCSSQFNMTFEAIKTPLHNFDDAVKNWALESKVELRKTVTSFFKTKMLSSNDLCCVCATCTSTCVKCSSRVTCCCTGSTCVCRFCSFGNPVMVN